MVKRVWQLYPLRKQSSRENWINPENMPTRKVKFAKQQQPKAKPKKTRSRKGPGPMEQLGTMLGGLGGAYFGAPGIGTALGRLAGKGVGWITGTGDYVTNFQGISQNACTSPSFSGNENTIISKREYLCDITSGAIVGTSSGFTIQTFPINPGQSETFPWLSNIAGNYEQYDIMGMVFEFKSTSGDTTGVNTSLGSVIMATAYDPTKPAFTSKFQMEDYFFASSFKPSTSALHAIECKNSTAPTGGLLYTRTGDSTVSGTDLRWSDFGTFFIATQGMPNAGTNLGELWVSYKIKLSKPRLPQTITLGGQIGSAHIARSGCTTAAPLGGATVFSSGPLSFTVSGTRLSWIGIPDMNYYVVVNVTAATSVTGLFTTTTGNVVGVNLFANDTANSYAAGSTSVTQTFQRVVQSIAPLPNQLCFLDFSGTITGTATADIFIVQMDELTIQ